MRSSCVPVDRVVWQCDPCCPTRGIEPPCHACAEGNYTLCVHRYTPTTPAPTGGGWSEEMILHERQLFLVPDAIPDEQAALLEAAARAVHAALRRQPQPGEQALVIGTDVEGMLSDTGAAGICAEREYRRAARCAVSRRDGGAHGRVTDVARQRSAGGHRAGDWLAAAEQWTAPSYSPAASMSSMTPSAPKRRCNRRCGGHVPRARWCWRASDPSH